MEFNTFTGIIIGCSFSIILIAARFMWFTVEEGHRASLHSFGQALRNQDQSLKIWNPGFYFKLPWQAVIPVSVMEKNINLGNGSDFFEVLTLDGTQLSFETHVRVKANLNSLEKVIYKIKNPEKHIAYFLKGVFRSVVSSYGEGLEPGEVLIKIRNEKKQMLDLMKNACAQKLRNDYGMDLAGLDIVDVRPPENLENALNSVQTARADAEYIIAKAYAKKDVKMLNAKESLNVAIAESLAAQTQIEVASGYLQSLNKEKTLNKYINRREDEVYSKSNLNIINRGV